MNSSPSLSTLFETDPWAERWEGSFREADAVRAGGQASCFDDVHDSASPIAFDHRRSLRVNRIPCVGEKAPLFEAMAFHGGMEVEVHLSGYEGRWVVLAFFPGDFTCVCPTEIAAVAVKYPAFQELGAEVLMVSTDTVRTHREFQENHLSRMVPGGARFPLVADPLGAVGRLYGVYDADAKSELRGHFIIDPQGVIQSLEVVAAPLGRSLTEILRQLRALREHETTGRWMPCGWEPGKPTLALADETGEPTRPWDTWKPRNAF